MTQCNDGARKLERTEQLHDIYRQMVFSKLKVHTTPCLVVTQVSVACHQWPHSHPSALQPFPLVSVSRQLERKGPLCRLQVEQKMFGKVKIKKTQLYVFSFTDYIFITKKKTRLERDCAYCVDFIPACGKAPCLEERWRCTPICIS